MALGHLGVQKPIANLEIENNQEARICRVFYDTARNQTMRDFEWPFISKKETLALIQTLPTTHEWTYEYAYPANCKFFKRILSGIRNDNKQSAIPFKIVYGTSSQVIHTDVQDAEGEFTLLDINPDRFPDDFVMALSLRLAIYIAPVVTAGDPFGLAKRVAQMYEWEITRARANAANEEQMEEPPESEYIRARD